MTAVANTMTLGYRLGMTDPIDTRRVAHLVAAVRCGSLSAAAVELGLTQPALSKSIRALERSLELRLLERGRHGVVATEAGAALVARGHAIDAELRAAADEIDSLRRTGRARVTIGCGPSEATRLLPIALEALHATDPDLRVTVLYGLNEALMPMVRDCEVDFALSSVPRTASDPALQHEPLRTDSAAVVAHVDHPLAHRRSVRPAELVGQRWVLARRRELERRALDDLLLQAGLPPIEAEIETTSATLMKAIVLQGRHLSFLPREMIHWEERAGLLRAVPVAASQWARAVGITRRRRGTPTAAATKLAAALRACAARLDAPRPAR
jgi:DNA-binding transcriptional LysR family regulator